MSKQQGRTRLDFDDETALKDVCGEHCRNLEMIEKALDVVLHAPGGGVLIDGREIQRARAAEVLQALYDAALRGKPIDRQTVTGELSFIGQQEAKEPREVIRFGRGHKRVEPRNRAQQQYLRALRDQKNDLVFGLGAAGTGKTFLAVAVGASELMARHVRRLVIARPAIEAGERLGFLPGDLEEKVDPYMMPVWDALDDTLGHDKVMKLRDEGKIQIAPLAFMRGRTLSNSFVLLDEAQNATRAQMQMVLTRLGEGSKMVVTGDPDQSDLPTREPSGLNHAIRILDGVAGVRMHRFSADDVVRHPLVTRIVRAYAQDEKVENGVKE